MQAPDRRSGKEGNNQCYQEAHAAHQRFHDGPGLEGGLFVHAHKALHQPEAGVVEVGAFGLYLMFMVGFPFSSTYCVAI